VWEGGIRETKISEKVTFVQSVHSKNGSFEAAELIAGVRIDADLEACSGDWPGWAKDIAILRPRRMDRVGQITD
jgi:hypothetical protein